MSFSNLDWWNTYIGAVSQMYNMWTLFPKCMKKLLITHCFQTYENQTNVRCFPNMKNPLLVRCFQRYGTKALFSNMWKTKYKRCFPKRNYQYQSATFKIWIFMVFSGCITMYTEALFFFFQKLMSRRYLCVCTYTTTCFDRITYCKWE